MRFSFRQLLFLVCVAAAAARTQRELPVPKELLERVGDWAENYPATIPSYAARETVVEWRFDKKGKAESERRTEFDYTLVRPAGRPREVVESRARAEGTENLAKGEGKRVGREKGSDSGEAEFAKLILLPTRFATRNQDKLKFYFGQDNSEVGSDTVVIGYRQSGDASLLEMDGKPVRVSGRAWVNPDDGSIVRVEEQFEHKGTLYLTGVDYARADGVEHWLPKKINIQYFDKGRLTLQRVYTYEGFRRLDPGRIRGAASARP